MQVTSEHVKILFVSHRLHVMSLRYKLLWNRLYCCWASCSLDRQLLLQWGEGWHKL